MSAPRTTRLHRGGFTLLELMIVIVVIAILAAFLLPAINSAKLNVRAAQVSTEIAGFDAAISDFKATYGITPPSTIVLCEAADDWAMQTASKAILRRMWPQFDFTIDRDIDDDGNMTDTHVLSGAECLVFFLGGMYEADDGSLRGFSQNPRDPFSRTGTNRKGPFFKFDIGRLVDVDSDGMREYIDSLASQTTPYLYLYGHGRNAYPNTATDDDLEVFGAGDSRNMSSAYRRPGTSGQFFEPNGYQIISPGFDFAYGTGGAYDPDQPDSDLVGTRINERDNITNFRGGRLAN